jgi:hypothetical protein
MKQARQAIYISILLILSISLSSAIQISDLPISLSRFENHVGPTQTSQLSFQIQDKDISISKDQGYDFINIEDSYYAYPSGSPNLPRKNLTIPLQKNEIITSVKITSANLEEFNNINIIPVEQENFSEVFTDMSEQEMEQIYQQRGYPGELRPNQEIYNSNKLFPYENIYYSTYYENNQRVGKIRIPAVIYNPKLKKAYIIKNLQLEVQTGDMNNILLQTPIHPRASSAASTPAQASSTSSTTTPPEVEWEKTYGGSDWDGGRSVQQTTDGGYVIGGYTVSFDLEDINFGLGGLNVYLFKTNSLGDLQWEKTFGGIESDVGYSVQQTTDGGYVIAGRTESSGAGSSDAYLIKHNAVENGQWSKTYGGSDWDGGRSVQQTTDGGYIIAGSTESFGLGQSDVYLIKIDATGNGQWSKTYGGNEWDQGQSVQQTTDEGFIIVGSTSSFGAGSSDVYLIKTDSSGNLQWEKTFGGIESDVGYSVQQTTDGGYIIAGETKSIGAGNYDFYLVKIDSRGKKQWEKTFGGIESDVGYSVQQTTDEGFIIVGSTNSFGGIIGLYLVKTDSSGNLQWEKVVGKSIWDIGYSVQQTTDGGYIIAGHTSTSREKESFDVYLIKLAPEAPPSCTDSLKNGFEEGIDCGWACGNSCGKCKQIINNGPSKDKIDVVFTGSGFPDIASFEQTVNDSIDYNSDNFGLMYYEPFKSYKDRFNFWRVDDLQTFTLDNYESKADNQADSCPVKVDQLIHLSVEPKFVSHAYLDNYGNGKKQAFVTIGQEYLTNSNWPLDIYDKRANDTVPFGSTKSDIIKTVVHEFGHSFGGLYDEYNSSQLGINSFQIPNCDHSLSCNKWSNITGSCIMGCRYSNWFRAYPNTLMRSQYSSTSVFKQINENELIMDILSNSHASSPLSPSLPHQEYDLSYFLDLNYYQGNISLNNFKLISGQSTIENLGLYKIKTISFNNTVIQEDYFDFTLMAAYSVPQNWFDENGTQIFTPSEGAIIVLEEKDETFTFPYHPMAEKIQILENNTLLFEINVSQYHDLDEDNLPAVIDNCPDVYNPGQENHDNNSLGYACDSMPGDPNRDGIVDKNDLAIIRLNFGLLNATWENGDFTNNSIVDGEDLSLLRVNFGFSFPLTSITPVGESFQNPEIQLLSQNKSTVEITKPQCKNNCQSIYKESNKDCRNLQRKDFKSCRKDARKEKAICNKSCNIIN